MTLSSAGSEQRNVGDAEATDAAVGTADHVDGERDNGAVEERLPTEPGAVEESLDLARLCWLLTTVAFLIAVVVLVLRGDMGYAGVTLAVALAAAINLR